MILPIEGHSLSYEMGWEAAAFELRRIGVPKPEKLLDYLANFKSCTYVTADDRWYYEAPADASVMIPAVRARSLSTGALL